MHLTTSLQARYAGIVQSLTSDLLMMRALLINEIMIKELWIKVLLMAVLLMGAETALAADNVTKRITVKPHLSQLKPQDVAIIFNRDDAESVRLATLYQQRRQIPSENLIGVALPNPVPDRLSLQAFAALKAQLEAKLTQQQVLLVVWQAPYAVECFSLTAALTLGVNPDVCAHTCGATVENPYFNSPSLQPLAQFKLRLSMLLPVMPDGATDALISRNSNQARIVAPAQAFFLKTSDRARSGPREPFFPADGLLINDLVHVHTLQQESIQGQARVVLYQTGQTHVTDLMSHQYLPGAIADHMTSFGGVLGGQTGHMPVTDWLQAGASGSYGSVSEPCNYWQKFPNPAILLMHYVAGATLVEAYWKSVKWPAQGLFVGDPLAQPFAPSASGDPHTAPSVEQSIHLGQPPDD